MWHVTRNMWQWWGVNILSKFQLPNSYGLGYTEFEEFEQKDDSMNECFNELINYKGVYRTALATRGLLNMKKK